ncbi:hypothetical protein Taro_051930 [Colocasia esculenta]|uniref:Strictosidine synthase conserved region domain-containing protein n=1 Tax=Colocasia esculenta TaxID=4460 RepID=A0A843XIQ5_COLES|nr:hypothetical protein [Colocasia esculenta]
MANPAEPPTSAASSGRGAVLACFVAVCVAAAVPASLLVAAIRGGVAFDAAPLPDDYSHHAVIPVAKHHSQVLRASDRVGEGLLPGPEDLAYDPSTGFLYASCRDGWVRRVQLGDLEGESPAAAAVEDWAYVGGRPLGVAFGPGKQLVVADAYKGKSRFGEMVLKYPWVRKMLGMAALLLQADASVPSLVEPGGVLRASLEGEALALYTDPELMLVTGALKIGNHLYYGLLVGNHVGRIRLDKLAVAAGK